MWGRPLYYLVIFARQLAEWCQNHQIYTVLGEGIFYFLPLFLLDRGM